MKELLKTVLYDQHVRLGGQMVAFAGWEMPLHYESGIVQEHLITRKMSGLFDVSHMGRFVIRGNDALPFLQHLLSNNAAALEEEEGQYTLIPTDTGGALDDAYLYRFVKDEYLLVVNASNREKNWDHFQTFLKRFDQVELIDRTTELSMLSLQGPVSKDILGGLITSGDLPEPLRNALSTAEINGARVLIARTGYTGEPICFELFVENNDTPMIWDILLKRGAHPIGLGARDTLRLEADLPLYGHEMGLDPEENEIPIFATSLARFAVSFSPLKGDFVGQKALLNQFAAYEKIVDRDFSLRVDLPRIIQPLELKDKGVARAGAGVFRGDQHVGFITSGTMVPYWDSQGVGLSSQQTGEKKMRAIALALMDSDLVEGDEIEIEIRGKKARAVIVPYHIRNEAPPFSWPIKYAQLREERGAICAADQMAENVRSLLEKTIVNTQWRQEECINLIPSEQTPSAMSRLLSIMDPVARYAEHKQIKAFKEADVFYYQGTDFIAEVEYLLTCELQKYLECAEVETRVVSGQMANMAVFSAMVDYLNRADRKSEQRRIRKVMNNHIIKDVAQTRELLIEHQPELVILGKSMIIHKEPVKELRAMIDELSLDCMIMYDMAHVLGLVGPYFQQPFKEGADIVTGSTHKTYYGTQRGIVAVNYTTDQKEYDFWEAIQRRAFPGSVSNHHLGTLLGLLLAAYEMNHFKDAYQKQILHNAKAFALALKDCGLDVAGDADISYTETHQVIINVGYTKGPEIARRLEDNNIILNYQAAPEEEGFTAAGSLRTGVQEMTRFGMTAEDFQKLAQFIADVVLKNKKVKDDISAFRKRFLDMQYCFGGKEYEDLMKNLHQMI
jgi:aminomethyltransferase